MSIANIGPAGASVRGRPAPRRPRGAPRAEAPRRRRLSSFASIAALAAALAAPFSTAIAQQVPPAESAPRAAAPPPIASLFETALSEAGSRGIRRDHFALAIDLPDGTRLAHRAESPLAPASTLKLVTAAAALDRLGPDHRLVTGLFHSGEVRGGVLHGDLIVVGGGDPAPSSRRFPDDPVAELRPWVQALRDLGIRRVDGDLVADILYLAGPARLEEWPREQLHRWYCAPSGALNLNDNCIDVVIAPSGGKIEVSLRPENPLFSVENALRSTRERDRHVYAVDRAADSWKIRVSGRFLATAGARTEWITAPDPARSFLGAWRALLSAEGIAVSGELRTAERDPAAIPIARIEHRVAETLPVLLKNSQNLYGDCLLRVTDRESGGDGSFASAGRTAHAFLAALGGGEGAVIRDGSGLSQRNRLCCADLLLVLERADRAAWRTPFWEALPLAGVDGTLDRRFRGTPLAGRLRGKTGHLAGVTGLAGGWEARGGAVRFAALAGGPGAPVGPFRDWLDGLLVRIDAELGGPPAPDAPPAPAGGL